MSEVSLERAHSETSPVMTPERIDNAKFAMWLYLASEVVIFAAFIAIYIVFRYNNPDIVHDVHEQVGILLVSFNTFLLLASSWSMVMGLQQIQRGNQQGLVQWIGITAVLGTVFVALQYVEYNELAHLGLSASTEFGMRFYAPTAFHGAHVIIGVLWALRVVMRARKGYYNAHNYLGVEIFGLYWHFVDVVWILLFTIIYLV